VPSFPHKALQKWLKNIESLSDTILLGSPCKRTTSLKKRFAIKQASSTLWHGIKLAILEKRTTTTKIESIPFNVLGRPKIKSIEISVEHRSFDVSNPHEA